MTDEKVIMLIEAKIQPPRRAELIDALREYLPLVRTEPGVEAFYVNARKDDPNARQIMLLLEIALSGSNSHAASNDISNSFSNRLHEQR